MGVGNYHVPAGHDTVVHALKPSALVIGTVICGHKWPATQACGPQSRPGRGTAAGVDKIDLLALDQVPQPPSVDQHRQRILRAGVESDDLTASFGYLGHHPAALGDHQRTATSG